MPIHTDVNRLPECVELPAELAAALVTDRPTLGGGLNPASSAEDAAAIGRMFGVLLDHNSHLGNRVDELEHHLDLLAQELRVQRDETRGQEAALSRIQQFTRLPVDPKAG